MCVALIPGERGVPVPSDKNVIRMVRTKYPEPEIVTDIDFVLSSGDEKSPLQSLSVPV